MYSDDLNQTPRAECNSSAGHPEGLLGERPPAVVGVKKLLRVVFKPDVSPKSGF